MYIEFYDFNTSAGYQANCTGASGRLEINDDIDISNPDQYVHERDNDGDARFQVGIFGWWIGCQYAIRLKWKTGEHVDLVCDSNKKLRNDIESQNKILAYFKRLVANGFKYTPLVEEDDGLYEVTDEFEDI